MTEDDRGSAGGGPGQAAGRQEDCLLMLVYKDRCERSKGLRERSSLTLEDICGLEPALPYEGLAHTLAIICLSQAVMLGFDSHEAMCAWDTRIRYALGEVHRFHVTVAPGTKLESGPATLHLCNDILVLARDIPPAVMGQWKLSDLRRYGAVPNGFIFEGGTRCGYWAGVFFLSSTEGEQISFLFDCIVRGISPTKGPFGLRPVLPGVCGNVAGKMHMVVQGLLTCFINLVRACGLLDPGMPQLQGLDMAVQGTGGTGPEEQVPTAYSLAASQPNVDIVKASGDDRSLSSSSSEASHSDISASSRLTAWPEQSSSSASTSQEGPGLVAAQGPGEAMLGASRPPLKPLRPRQLQEVGRQSSSDSGIATGSHSSYSGSFSSYAGSSLDVWRAGEEFGSLLSLPPGASVPEPKLCACPPGVAEYQVPTSLRQHYDTPRSLRQGPRDPSPASQGSSDHSSATDLGGSPGPMAADSPGPERPCSEMPTYVNIPISPTSRLQLHYMGLEFPGASGGVRGASSSRYAQIDITATETAHRVGAQHAKTREERLPELEQQKKGP
ncbi:hypothetical protein A6R68_14266 [Neotoma lepida]|uniref:IRS-type PTB domain-containing protein n=1 Tax=Neotoma lepida TaxID=56216 RepID=A0A1A6HC36_NEOLE|nr:hypothetical protein A6R68_14266 [Neotoma lepida]